MKGIWITWEKQRRNIGLSSALGWPLYEIISDKPQIKRYLNSVRKTIETIWKEKPEILIVQNPSIVLTTLSAILKLLFGYKMVMDAHNAGIYPSEGHNKLLMKLSKRLQKKADLVIITNEDLKKVVEKNGGKAFILPDKLPETHSAPSYPFKGKINIVFICTYATDEPFLEVFKAAEKLPDDIIIYVTGKYIGKVDPSSVPKNVKLLGFIPDEIFWSLLNSADFLMDLTTRENCLVCGAYEGTALEKPLILSDTKSLRTYFNMGSVFVKPEAESIAIGVIEAINKYSELKKDIKRMKIILEESWEKTFKDFQFKLYSL
jgi:glycosyltransferase involved in cell wall biosynthesis